MTLWKDNWLLTAYALGELDAAEAAEVKQAIAADESLRAEVDAIRATACELEAQLGEEPAPRLLPIQRERLMQQARELSRHDVAPGRDATKPPQLLRRTLLAVAAAVLLLAGAAGLWTFLNRPTGQDANPIAGVTGTSNDSNVGGVYEPPLVPTPSPFDPAQSATPRPNEDADFFHPYRPSVGSLAFSAAGEAVPPPEPGDDGAYENPSYAPAQTQRSTFGMAVDVSSYLHVHQLIFEESRLPEPADVRIEEMVNYFPYAYHGPDEAGDDALAVRTTLARCPWKPGHVLLRVAIKAREDDQAGDGNADVVARDARAFVDFNPAVVTSWRLIGFDAPAEARDGSGADVPAGASLTVLYELALTNNAAAAGHVCTASVEYTLPRDDETRRAVARCDATPTAFDDADADLRFAASVAAFGMILRDSPHKGAWSVEDVMTHARAAAGINRPGRRGMFLAVLREAQGALLPAE